MEPDPLNDGPQVVAALPGLADREVLAHRLDGALRAMRAVGSDRGVGLLRVGGRAGRVVEVATRLRSAVRPGDTMAVVAPETFVVLCERFDAPDDLLAIAHRIEERLCEPPALEPVLDVALVDPNDRDPAAILSEAAALGQTVGVGELPVGRWIRFSDVLRDRAALRELVEAALRDTSDGRDLVLAFQPERDLRTGRIVGVEALLRWTWDGRIVSPDEFVPVAERTGLIVPIGAWVLREACRQLADWRRDGVAGDVSVAVNVSPRQLLDDGFVGLVADVLAETELDGRDLVLELTEGVLLADPASVRGDLDELRALGVRIAVDDFGTGYASLTYLHRLPVDVVKLDRSFVEGIGVDDRLTAIVASVLGLLDALGLASIAEGVATRDQADRLREMGCDLAQGTLVGPPVSPAAILEHLRDEGGSVGVGEPEDRRAI